MVTSERVYVFGCGLSAYLVNECHVPSAEMPSRQ